MSKRFETDTLSNGDRLFYAASHDIVRAIAILAFGHKVKGKENIPAAGILACNHLHGSDVVFVPASVPESHVTVIGRRGVMNPLFDKWGAITIDRPEDGENMSRQQLLEMEQPLRDGKLELLFTPGTRTPGFSPGLSKRGVALMARRTETDVTPVIIKGSDNLALQDVTVMFGESIGRPTHKSEDDDFLYYLRDVHRNMFESIVNRSFYRDPVDIKL